MNVSGTYYIVELKDGEFIHDYEGYPESGYSFTEAKAYKDEEKADKVMRASRSQLNDSYDPQVIEINVEVV